MLKHIIKPLQIDTGEAPAASHRHRHFNPVMIPMINSQVNNDNPSLNPLHTNTYTRSLDTLLDI